MVTVDSQDPRVLADWWARQTGGEVLDENDGWFVQVRVPGHTPDLGFQRVEGPTPGKNRVHLDLEAQDPAAVVERLVREGAREVARHEVAGFAWVVLSDPEGNEFCVAPPH